MTVTSRPSIVKSIQRLVVDLMSDELVQVRNQAQRVLMGFIHSHFVPMDEQKNLVKVRPIVLFLFCFSSVGVASPTKGNTTPRLDRERSLMPSHPPFTRLHNGFLLFLLLINSDFIDCYLRNEKAA